MVRKKGIKISDRQARIIAIVIAGSATAWLVAQFIGYQLGLPGHYALIFDFALMGALLWALLNCIVILRKYFADKE